MIEGVKKLQPKGTLVVLSGENNDQINTLDTPTAISPKQEEVTLKGKNLKLTLKALSFNVIRIKML